MTLWLWLLSFVVIYLVFLTAVTYMLLHDTRQVLHDTRQVLTIVIDGLATMILKYEKDI